MEEYETKENWLSAFMRRIWWTYLVAGGMLIGFAFGTLNMQSEAINKGFAHYHSQTGKWEWGYVADIKIEEPLPTTVTKGAKNVK